MSGTNFSNFAFFCLKSLTTLIKSCPCFFLICLKILFWPYNFIMKSITRSLIISKKPRKMTNDFFNHYIFVRTFQWTSSECLTNVTITVKSYYGYIYKRWKWLTKFDVRTIFRDLQTSKVAYHHFLFLMWILCYHGSHLI